MRLVLLLNNLEETQQVFSIHIKVKGCLVQTQAGRRVYLKGKVFNVLLHDESPHVRPIILLASKTVVLGVGGQLVLRSVSDETLTSVVKATYDGVMRFPWSLAMISTRPFLNTPTLGQK